VTGLGRPALQGRRRPSDHGTALALIRSVTVRITIVGDGAPRRIVIEGRLTSAEVGELELAVGDDPTSTCLDLENLRSADGVGLAALRRLHAEGARLRSVPPHLAWRIQAENDE
jgi:hypothetical protein